MAPDSGSSLFALRFWPGYIVLGGTLLYWGLVIGGLGLGAGTLAKSSALELWLAQTSRPFAVMVTHQDFVSGKTVLGGKVKYRNHVCYQHSFFQTDSGPHWIPTALHKSPCRSDENGVAALSTGRTITVRRSALDDGYALAGWSLGTSLSAAFLGLLSVAGLWLVWKSKPLWPELRAWAGRGPKS